MLSILLDFDCCGYLQANVQFDQLEEWTKLTGVADAFAAFSLLEKLFRSSFASFKALGLILDARL